MLQLQHITAINDTTRPWLIQAEAVHRELRPQMDASYLTQLEEIFAEGGELVLATEEQAGRNAVVGLALFRVYRDTFNGRKLYVDDLVTTALKRSGGVGHALITWLKEEGARRHAVNVVLDSGCQRTDAHRFYFREGFVITSFNFKAAIKPTK
ncbi:Aste57867_7996 [Aphanomyces stellatus]|uniref:Aste57867_7996 protein n=1 Tax=Aphanomyces stellatus TaxID=120398 RepID=A0A485KJ59_9STRA|nr:hypothetical protein As57867_007966 [Aphanomyces stellatus]VFT84889.1 Aste57867_7996 [Aphanomyces stellatus]